MASQHKLILALEFQVPMGTYSGQYTVYKYMLLVYKTYKNPCTDTLYRSAVLV